MAGLDPLYPCMSRESADPLTIPRQQIVAEIARELHRRRDSYPRRVRDGKLTQIQADWQIDVLAAVHADLEADLFLNPASTREWLERRSRADERLASFRWQDLVRALRREIDLRRRYYPQRVADGDMAPLAARSQLERFEAAHFSYWVQARQWWPEELEHRRGRPDELTEADRATWRTAYDAHRARFLDIETAPRGDYAPTASESDGWAA